MVGVDNRPDQAMGRFVSWHNAHGETTLS
jgi:hypothetical protein